MTPGDGPFHAGEVALQTRVGNRAKMAEIGPRMIQDHLPERHRELLTHLPFVLVGFVDAEGRPGIEWLSGRPGFARALDEHRIRIDRDERRFEPGEPIGLLAIQPHTRRRNRANGIVLESDDRGFTMGVEQAFGNCPKYIQPWGVSYDPSVLRPSPVHHGSRLGPEGTRLLQSADMLFMATAHPAAGRSGAAMHGVDVSHRGGPPGFVRVLSGNEVDTLELPDYVGNGAFNTLGNLEVNPVVALTRLDPETQELLTVSGSTSLREDVALATRPGQTGRVLQIMVERVTRTTHAVPLRWR